MSAPLPADGAGHADAHEIRRVQPYQATKAYLCPGCNQVIPTGTGHLVVVPLDAPDLRRHWHDPCWGQRGRRHPGRP